MNVPFFDVAAANAPLREEILAEWDKILSSGAFTGGDAVRLFEEEMAAACDVQSFVAVSSGTDALRFALMALELEPGDEVITVPNTFIATTEAISQAGGIPRFVDVSPETYTMDPRQLEAAITATAMGVIPVHLFGQTADMDPILEIAAEHELWVLEDAAQAHFAEYKSRKAGALGNAGAFSFRPAVNLGACGEAGGVATNDEELAAAVRMLRAHGQSEKNHHAFEGYNGRCDALQAAALRVKLKHIDAANEQRRAIAARYTERLAGVEGIAPPQVAPGNLPVWHVYAVQVAWRDAVAAGLKSRGIETGIHYPVPLHQQQAYLWMGHGKGSFPVCESLSERLLSLPLYPTLGDKEIDYISDTLKEVVGAHG